MKSSRYQLESGKSLAQFEFISEGPRGRILKIVQFKPTSLKDVYNLGFGDKNHSTGEIDDTIISNNGDGEKVLATVAATVYAFIDKHPRAYIYVTGSTKSRIRLYRMGISKNLSEIKNDFEIYGSINGNWEHFKSDGEYDGFLVVQKPNKKYSLKDLFA